MFTDDRGDLRLGRVVSFILLLVLLVVLLLAWGRPQWEVYNSQMVGKARLAEAEYGRQALVSEAKARQDAAEMEAHAIRTVGKALDDNPKYLTRLWIEKVNENGNSVIYVPTEAGLPILEAGRRIDQKSK